MTWERVVAGLEALGTGAASPRPAASLLDALSAAGLEKAALVAAPTQSRKKKRPGDPDDVTSLLAGAAGGGGALAAYLAARGGVAGRGVHEVVTLPGEDRGVTIRGEVNWLTDRPAVIEGRGPYVRLSSADMPSAVFAHGAFGNKAEAMSRLHSLLRDEPGRNPVTVEIDTHGAPGVLAGRTGHPIPLKPGERANDMVGPKPTGSQIVPGAAPARFVTEGTAADFGRDLARAVCGRPGSLSSPACNFATGPDGRRAGQDMADASGLKLTFNRAYGFANPWRAHTVRGDEPWLPPGGRAKPYTGAVSGGTTTFERGKAPIDRVSGPPTEDGTLTRRSHFVNPLNQSVFGRFFQPAYRAGPYAALLGGIGAAALNKKLAPLAAVLGTIGTLPMTLSELGASYGNLRARAHHGQDLQVGSELGRLAPYLALSATPALAYALSRLLGRDDAEKKRKARRTAAEAATAERQKWAFDEATVENAGVVGDVAAIDKLVSDPAPPPPHDLLRKWISYTNKLDNRGDFVGTAHKRIAIPKTNFGRDEIERLGFQSVLAAVPETGQDEFRSYRRVDDNYHLHSHPGYWTLHKDEQPSMTIALQKAEGPAEKLQALLSGGSHVLHEGVPGMYYYLRNKLTGGADMAARMDRPSHIRSVKRAATAVVVKGNPKFITGNEKADRFYAALQAALQSAGYDVSFDPGEDFTEPPPADLWVGHSRGVGRLRFAPPGTRTIAVGSNAPGAVNHPDDDVLTPFHQTGGAPPDAHYELTPEMVSAMGLGKAAAADPDDLILVSGHSGAGKSTVAKEISGRTGAPVVSLDDHPDFKAFFRSDPDNLHLRPGTPQRAEFQQLRRRVALETLSALSGPAVVEGTQLAALPSRTLQTFPNRVLVTTPLRQLLRQRLERVKGKAVAKGKEWTPEVEAKRYQVGRDVYDGYRASMNRFRRVPGTAVHGSRDPVDDLLAKLTAKTAGVVAHVAGPSGSGKTTLMNELAARHPGLVTKDLDDFDELAGAHLGYTGIPKRDYTDDMLSALAGVRQKTMDDWIAAQGDRPVVLGGHHWEGDHVLRLPEGADRFTLSTSPLLSAWRAYRRSQTEAPEYRRRLSELPSDWREAISDAKRLKRLGYVTASPDEIEAAVVPRLSDQARPADKTAALHRLHDAVTIRWPGVVHAGANLPEDEMSKTVKVAGLPAVKIDRPKGFQKVFPTPAGPVTKAYPVDYGYFDGVINPDDNEGADVFVGDGTLHGRFMKGKNLSGKWEPDERKWFMNLTPEQLAAVKEMFTSQSPDLLQDEVQFADEAELARDLAALQAKTAAHRLHDLLCPAGQGDG